MKRLPRALARRLPARWRELLRAAAALALDRRMRWSRRRAAIVLVYHRLGDPPGDTRFELVPAVGSELFRAELAHLARRYEVVRASDVLDAASDRRRGGRFPVAITFDDDLASHVEVAAPALRAEGLPATFFLTCPSRPAPARSWWQSLQVAIDLKLVGAEDLPPLPPHLVASSLDRVPHAIHVLAKATESLPPDELEAVAAELERRTAATPADAELSPAQVATLARDGLEIGFHTRDHRLLTNLGNDELRAALREGKPELEHVVGGSITLLAYPHGKADARVAAAAREAGYTLAFTGWRLPATPDTDRFLVGRLEPRADTPGRFALELAQALASG